LRMEAGISMTLESWNFILLAEPLTLNFIASMAAWQWSQGRRKVQRLLYKSHPHPHPTITQATRHEIACSIQWVPIPTVGNNCFQEEWVNIMVITKSHGIKLSTIPTLRTRFIIGGVYCQDISRRGN